MSISLVIQAFVCSNQSCPVLIKNNTTQASQLRGFFIAY